MCCCTSSTLDNFVKNCCGVNILIPMYSFMVRTSLSPGITVCASNATAHSMNLSSSGSFFYLWRLCRKQEAETPGEKGQQFFKFIFFRQTGPAKDINIFVKNSIRKTEGYFSRFPQAYNFPWL